MIAADPATFDVASFPNRPEPCSTAPINLSTSVPVAADVHQFADAMFDFLFPADRHQLLKAAVRYDELVNQLQALLCPLAIDGDSITATFFEALPTISDKLLEDANAVLDFDPAATSLEEVIFAYPGFYATAIYRLAHELYRLRVPLLPRMIAEYAHSKTGIDIHPAAQIGQAFVIDHGTGTVIGATACIGDHVILYHGVTLGALHVEKALANTKRHPTIEDHVIIYSHATILGGDTIIGHHSVLGGNVWITESVRPYSRIYFQPPVNPTDQSIVH